MYYCSRGNRALLFLSLLFLLLPLKSAVCYEAAAHCIILHWSAPGDDAAQGRAATYDLRYSIKPLTVENFSSASKAKFVSSPQPAGSPEQAMVGGLESNTTYYFAIRAADEWLNWSPMSNVIQATTTEDICIGEAGNVDCDPNEEIGIGDLTTLIIYLFIDVEASCICLGEANIDGSIDGTVDIGDVSALVDYLFGSKVLLPPCN